MAHDAVLVNLDELLAKLHRMQLDESAKASLNKRLGRAVMRANAACIRDGIGADGKAWKPLKPKRVNGKIKPKGKRLYGMRRELRFWQDGDDLVVSFATKGFRRLAAINHRGSQSVRTAAQAARMYRRQNDGPCRPKLAKALKQAGFTYQRKDKRGVSKTASPPVKWICAHLTERQAVSALKRLRGATSKNRWTIKMPARPLLAPHHEVVLAELQRFLSNS